MENHGALCIGKSPLNAFDRLECLEQAAKLSALSHLVNAEGIEEKERNRIADMR